MGKLFNKFFISVLFSLFLIFISFNLLQFKIAKIAEVSAQDFYYEDVEKFKEPESLLEKIRSNVTNFWGIIKQRVPLFLKAQISPQESIVQFTKLGRLVLPNGNASAIEKYGNYVYMVLNETSKSPLVYDVSDPEKPKLVNALPAQGWPTRLRMVEGTKWLWAVHGNTWAFYDLTDPANPRLAGSNEGPNVKFITLGNDNPPYSFKQHPNLTYMAVANENVLFYGREDKEKKFLWTEIYDITNPKSPKLLSRIDNASPRVLRGNILLTATYPSQNQAGTEVRVYDVSDPSNPKLLTIINTPRSLIYNLFTFNDAFDYDPATNRLYIATGRVKIKIYGIETFDPRLGRTSSGIAVYDVSDWSNPKLLGHSYFPDYKNATYISNVDWIVYNNGFIYGSDVYYGLKVYDVRDPQNIKYVHGHKAGGEVSGIAIVPERNLVLLNQNLQGGLIFVDVSDLNNPIEINNIPHGFANWGGNQVFKNNYLIFPGGRRYIASGLFIVDFADLFNPKINFNPNIISCFLLEDGYCYGAWHIGYSDIYKFSLTNMFEPQVVKERWIKELLPETSAHNKYLRVNTDLSIIAYKEPFLFLLNTKDGAGIRDINDNDKRLGATLYIVDISERTNPRLLGQLDILNGPVHRVVTSAIIENKLFISWWGSIVAVDFSDIMRPKLLGIWSPSALGLPSHYTHVWTDGELLFVGSYRNALAVYDVSDLSKGPKLIGKIDNLCTSWIMTGDASKNLIYRTCLDGLQIISYQKPKTEVTGNRSPYLPFIISPKDQEIYNATTSFLVEFKAKLEDPDKDKVKVDLEVRDEDNNLVFSTSTPLVESNSIVTIKQDFNVGNYKWKMKVVDENGFESRWSDENRFSIVIPPPPKPINNPPDISVAEPGKKLIANTTTIRAYIAVKDPEGESVILTVEFVDASSSEVVYSSSTPYEPPQTHKYLYYTLKPGKYYMKIYAKDASGNVKKFPHFEPYIEIPEVVLADKAPNPPKIKLLTPIKREKRVIDNKEVEIACIETRTPEFEIEGTDPEGDDLTYKLIIRDNQYPWNPLRDIEIQIPEVKKSGEKFIFKIPEQYALHPVEWGYRIWIEANDGKLPSERVELGGFPFGNICKKETNNKPNPPEIIFPPDDFVFQRFIPTATTVLRNNFQFKIKGTDPDPEDTLRYKIVFTNEETGGQTVRDQTFTHKPYNKRYFRGWDKLYYKQNEEAILDVEKGEILMSPGHYKVEVYANDGFEWSEPTIIKITIL